jgi:hypothetical protein
MNPSTNNQDTDNKPTSQDELSAQIKLALEAAMQDGWDSGDYDDMLDAATEYITTHYTPKTEQRAVERRSAMYGQMQMLEWLYVIGAIDQQQLAYYSNPLRLAKYSHRKVKHWPFDDVPTTLTTDKENPDDR